QVGQFVAEYGDAAGFESDDGNAGFDFGFELIEDSEEQVFGAVQHAEVVERASAAEVGLRDQDAESGSFQDFYGGAGGLGDEVGVEGDGQETLLGAGRPRLEARSFRRAGTAGPLRLC